MATAGTSKMRLVDDSGPGGKFEFELKWDNELPNAMKEKILDGCRSLKDASDLWKSLFET